jgi:hypothetical protein
LALVAVDALINTIVAGWDWEDESEWQVVGSPERAAAMPCTLRRAVAQALFLKLFNANR